MKHSERALIIGNLAGNSPVSDGQVIKSQQILRSFKNQSNFKIEAIDTSGPKFGILASTIREMQRVDAVFLLPGKRMVLVFALLTRIVILVHGERPKVHLIVVGGWLASSLTNPAYRWALRHVDTVSPEILSMWDPAGLLGPRALELPNFREIEDLPVRGKTRISAVRRFVFISRVTRTKGIFDAISSINSLLYRGARVQLDIYGPLVFENDRDEKLFHVALNKSDGTINYRGNLHPADVAKSLARYECCLFPSFYRGEGFPGVIVEALLVGIPVIARSHMFLGEINHQFDFGLVISGDFVTGAVDALSTNFTFLWKKKWAGLDRRTELMKRLGPDAFDDWLRQVEADNLNL